MDLRWFDAHLDLACLAENGRDMRRGPEDCGGPWPPATLTFPSMREGRVEACLATIFTEADGKDAVRYAAGDAEAAHAAGVRQLGWYERWAREGLIGPLRGGGGAGVRAGILVEGADPVRGPEELGWWAARGVVAVGLAWARGSRYAAGNAGPAFGGAEGLTGPGREMVRAIDEHGLVHDLSHLSPAATEEVLGLVRGRVMASHSNARALLGGRENPGWARHLGDEAIREVARRGGVIGLNLVRHFIRAGLRRDDPEDRPTVDEAIAHVEHVCELVGHRRAVGLGSDLDGGISGHDLPRGIGRPADFVRLAEALGRRGWPDEDIHGFAWGNWARFWGLEAGGTDGKGEGRGAIGR